MIINRYLTKEVTNALLAVVLVLMLAFLSQQIVRYLNYVAVGKIATNVLMQLVAFEVPYLLALLLPLGLYLGVMLAYGRLYVDNEMSILHMCGFDNRRVLNLTIKIALAVALIVWVLMLWVNPEISLKRQQIMESGEATLHLIQTLIPGRFQVSSDGRHVMYVEKLSRDHERAEKVFVAEQKKPSVTGALNDWMVVFASQGYQMKDKATGESFFVAADGYRYEGAPGQNDYKIIQFKKYAVRILQTDVHVAHGQGEAQTTWQLLQHASDPKNAAELQWRISIGISAFLLALLAVPLSRVRPRAGRFLILVPAVLVYIIYVHLLIVSRHWIEQGVVPPMLGMWWVHVLVLILISIVMLASARQAGGGSRA